MVATGVSHEPVDHARLNETVVSKLSLPQQQGNPPHFGQLIKEIWEEGESESIREAF